MSKVCRCYGDNTDRLFLEDQKVVCTFLENILEYSNFGFWNIRGYVKGVEFKLGGVHEDQYD